MVWDNVQTKFIYWRWGVANDVKQTFFDNGDVSIRGQILDCPTITQIGYSIDAKADTTYVNTQLALKDSITSVNTKLSTKVNTNASSVISAYLHFGNNAQSYTEYGTQNFGSISVNKNGGGQAEMNFIQNGFVSSGSSRAFNFMFATSNKTFTELVRINKNGDMSITGNVSSPNITTMNTNIALKCDTSYVDTQLLLKEDVTTVNSKLTNYALLNSSPTFTGNVKSQVYTGGLVRYDSSVSMNFTASTLPSTIVVDGASNLALYGIPEMPIGTRFTVIKTNSQTQLYSTAADVYFYTNRRNATWVSNLLIEEDARTFIRANIINQFNGATVKVWLTESSHIYNDSNELNAQAIGAWMLDGANFGRTAGTYRPIICSTKVFGPGNSDDGFIINPGYTIAIYPNENYGGTPVFVNNIYEYPTPRPYHYSSSPTNEMQSIKLWYNGTEVLIDGIS